MVTEEDVLKMGNLSRLYIDKSELSDFTEDMEKIMDFANRINDFEYGLEEKDTPDDKTNVLRKDSVAPSFDRELILKNANGGKEGFFYLKKFK